jgi:sRNA-binding protein
LKWDRTPTHTACTITVRTAAAWLRGIGGFGSVLKRHLCHIVSRLKEDEELTEAQIHAAIKAYSQSPWHREGHRWVAIQRFFLGDIMDHWIEEAPEHRAQREAAKSVGSSRRLNKKRFRPSDGPRS